MSEQIVDTRGIEPWRVFKALYNGASPQGVGFLHFTPEPMTEEEAKAIVGGADTGDYPGGRRSPMYFDYVKGRVMKVNLKNPDGFKSWLYDRDNGPGAAERAIAPLRTAVPA